MEKTNAARELYERILELNPEHVSADHMRAALSGETRNHSPNCYIREVFDQFAGHYEASLTDNLGYDLPSELLNIYQHLLPGRQTAATAGSRLRHWIGRRTILLVMSDQ